MEITFKNAKLQEVCSSEKRRIKKFGKICSDRIMARLDDLQAANTLADFRFLPGRCHELKGDRKGQLTLDIEHPLRLVFKPSNDGIQNRKEGVLNWNLVTAVEIVDVEDTHD